MAKIYWRNGVAWARATRQGKEVRQSLDTRSKTEARERFEKWLGELNNVSSRWHRAETHFATAVDVFSDRHLPTLKPSSRRRYLESLLKLAPHFENKTLQQIGKADLAAYVDARRKEGVTDSTIRRDLACLSSVYTIAEDWEMADANPVLGFMRTQKRRKRLMDSPSRERYLSHEEEGVILAQARARYDRERAAGLHTRALTALMQLSAIALAIDTGLRDEELLRLDWGDVDLDHHQVTVTAERAKNSRARVVPLLPRAQRILAGLPRHGRARTVIWHREGDQFSELNHALQRYGSRVGVTGIRWHDLRRTCGCRLLQDHKMPIEQVSQWLGHSSVTQTQKAYAFLRTDNLHESVGTRIRQDADLQARLAALPLIEG